MPIDVAVEGTVAGAGRGRGRSRTPSPVAVDRGLRCLLRRQHISLAAAWDGSERFLGAGRYPCPRCAPKTRGDATYPVPGT